MKRIGGGWQYTVYLKSPTRVRKVPRTTLERTISISLGLLFGQDFSLDQLRKEGKRVQEAAESSLKILKSIPNVNSISCIGNPSFEADGSYEQDYSRTFGKVLREVPRPRQEAMIDGYTKLVKQLWGYGFSDTTFNFSMNAGISFDGSVIQLDLGELTDSKDAVAVDIKAQRWRDRFSYNSLPGELKSYTEVIFERELNLESLNSCWNKNGPL